jgi:hypothetical protein
VAFTLPKPIDFSAVRRPAEDAVPRPRISKADRRRAACLREAAEVLKVLPGPGEALHALMTGRYDLTDLLAVLLERFGPAVLKVATLSFNKRNTVEMLAWLDDRKVTGLDLLCSAFFRDHNGELFRAFKQDLHQRGGRLAASRNHAKVVTMAFETGDRFALEGSANLRTNSNQEQFALIHDAGLHDWHAAWISDRVTQHEGDESHD